MVRAVKGVVIEWYYISLTNSDAAIKQIILDLDAKSSFVISDLDETHLFVDGNILSTIQEQLVQILEDNTYSWLWFEITFETSACKADVIQYNNIPVGTKLLIGIIENDNIVPSILLDLEDTSVL